MEILERRSAVVLETDLGLCFYSHLCPAREDSVLFLTIITDLFSSNRKFYLQSCDSFLHLNSCDCHWLSPLEIGLKTNL